MLNETLAEYAARGLTPPDNIKQASPAHARAQRRQLPAEPFARSLARLRAAADHPRVPRSGSRVEVDSGDLAALLFHFERVDSELRALERPTTQPATEPATLRERARAELRQAVTDGHLSPNAVRVAESGPAAFVVVAGRWDDGARNTKLISSPLTLDAALVEYAACACYPWRHIEYEGICLDVLEPAR